MVSEFGATPSSSRVLWSPRQGMPAANPAAMYARTTGLNSASGNITGKGPAAPCWAPAPPEKFSVLQNAGSNPSYDQRDDPVASDQASKSSRAPRTWAMAFRHTPGRRGLRRRAVGPVVVPAGEQRPFLRNGDVRIARRAAGLEDAPPH